MSYLEIFALIRVRHVVSSKRVTVQIKVSSLVRYNGKLFVRYLYCLENQILIPIAYMSHMTNQQPIPESPKFCVNQSQNCLHLNMIIYLELHVLITYKVYISRP